MSTDYIDISEISTKGVGAYIHRVAAVANPVLVFMPNLSYAGMHDAEEFAFQIHAGFLIIPITIPMLDLVKQMEYADIHITGSFVEGVESALRSSIIEQLNGQQQDMAVSI